jgi:hypothetical protein
VTAVTTETPISHTDLALINHMWETALTIRRGGAEAIPIGFVGYSEGNANIIPIYEFEKKMWPTILRAAASKPGASVVGLVSEAWSKITTDDADLAATSSALAAGLSISEMDGRVEVLHLIAETVDGGSVLRLVEVKDGAVLGEPREELTSDGGRMTGFFPPTSTGGH